MAPVDPQTSSNPDDPDRKIVNTPDPLAAQVANPNPGEELKTSDEVAEAEAEPQQRRTIDPRYGSWLLVITAIGTLLSGIAAVVALVPEDVREAFINTLITFVTSVF